MIFQSTIQILLKTLIYSDSILIAILILHCGLCQIAETNELQKLSTQTCLQDNVTGQNTMSHVLSLTGIHLMFA